jgi:hypothetical protein
MTTAPADTFRRTGEEAPLRPAPQLPGQLRDLLAGKKVVITGVTGFIGEQLLWKILTELPETRPSVLVRRKGSASARERIASLLRKPIFAEVVDAAGGVSACWTSGSRSSRATCRTYPSCPPTWTSWCTVRATCPSTHRSTRPSPPTWSGPRCCWSGC